jgi:neutral ceramidase
MTTHQSHGLRIIRSFQSVACLCAVFIMGAQALAAEPEWRVGLARVKITPAQPIFLAGYASRNKPFERVETDLFVKALALEDRDGKQAILVTSDLIGLPAGVAEPICERLHKQVGLARAQILLNSSHIHTGPELSLSDTPSEGRSPGDAQRTVHYTKQLQDKIVEVAVQALAHLEPAKLAWGNGVVNFVMNRREFTPRGVILGVNARGTADRSVPVLRVDTPDGKLRAVLFGTACHNTTLTDKDYMVCGDYAGYAQAYVEKEHGSAEALFMIGCAGDANPYPRGSLELARGHGEMLGKEVCRVLQTRLQPAHGPLQVAFDRVDLPLQAPPSHAELEKLAAKNQGIPTWVAKQMLARLERGEKLPTHYACPLAVWQFGADLTLVGLSGEVVVDYVGLLEKALGPNRLWLAAYCNDVFGYLPSARVLREGGYETRGLYSGGIGYFDPAAEGMLVAKVTELAKKAGRRLPGE